MQCDSDSDSSGGGGGGGGSGVSSLNFIVAKSWGSSRLQQRSIVQYWVTMRGWNCVQYDPGTAYTTHRLNTFLQPSGMVLRISQLIKRNI